MWSQTPTIALAGYTNVGKSTLLNALTGAEASIDDRLFETLDPTTRSFEHEGRRYLLTDTVGFIRRLPHELVEGFAATLEETLIADLVLHVADASADDGELDQMVQAVDTVLAEIGASELPIELVLNKIDRVDGETREQLGNRFPGCSTSAVSGEGLDELRARVAQRFEGRFQVVELLVLHERGDVVSSPYALGPLIESAKTAPTASSSARAFPSESCGAWRRSSFATPWRFP